MHPAEQNLREKAEAFKAAFLEARAAGFNIVWPVRANEISDILISGTAKVEPTVTNLDGSPVERDADGQIKGEPLNLTDEERAALPPLGDVGDGRLVYGQATGVPLEGVDVPADGVTRENLLEPAKGRKK